MEEKSLSTVMILLGGSMFLLVGFVTLVAVIPATFVSLIPIRENVFQQSNLLPVEWLLPFIGFSVVLILMALLMFRCARSIYTHDAARTKTSASLAVVASFAGLFVSYLWYSLAPLVSGGSSIFLYPLYSANAIIIPSLAFALSVTGALLVRWKVT